MSRRGGSMGVGPEGTTPGSGRFGRLWLAGLRPTGAVVARDRGAPAPRRYVIAVQERRRLPLHRRPLPLLAVGAAHLIGRLSAPRIHRILTVCSHGGRPATYAEAARARAEIVAVGPRHAGQGCLPRSIATVLLCRARGAWPTWRTGMRTVSTATHAWVEAEGRPVDDLPPTPGIPPIMTVAPRARVRGEAESRDAG
ncbi:lasso peptide biosynthesis B2 protein [Streptomyces brasiliscabiei]|uniref:Lasso peptide biosynthesis B2 protein n=1 Tax=Streptomyces brasiliscabiei TaxID=2736302 RepID=A0ABU8GR60_9ACTN